MPIVFIFNIGILKIILITSIYFFPFSKILVTKIIKFYIFLIKKKNSSNK